MVSANPKICHIRVRRDAYAKLYAQRGVFRRGGILGFFTSITIGRNLVMSKYHQDYKHSTYIHELWHYYQMLRMGIGKFYQRAAYEQFYLEGIKNKGIYNYQKYGRRYNESDASWVQDTFYYK